jgi:hypothetical protein
VVEAEASSAEGLLVMGKPEDTLLSLSGIVASRRSPRINPGGDDTSDSCDGSSPEDDGNPPKEDRELFGTLSCGCKGVDRRRCA